MWFPSLHLWLREVRSAFALLPVCSLGMESGPVWLAFILHISLVLQGDAKDGGDCSFWVHLCGNSYRMKTWSHLTFWHLERLTTTLKLCWDFIYLMDIIIEYNVSSEDRNFSKNVAIWQYGSFSEDIVNEWDSDSISRPPFPLSLLPSTQSKQVRRNMQVWFSDAAAFGMTWVFPLCLGLTHIPEAHAQGIQQCKMQRAHPVTWTRAGAGLCAAPQDSTMCLYSQYSKFVTFAKWRLQEERTQVNK